MEMEEKWQSGHKYLDMKDYFAWREEQRKQTEQTSKMSKIGRHNTISAEGRILHHT